MKCPAFIPPQLEYCQEVSSDDVVKVLKEKPVDMISFVQTACEDHAWLEDHEKLVGEMLQWITRLFFEDKLALDYIKSLVKTIQNNYSTVRPLLFFPNALYYNLTFVVDGKPFLINSLLFSAQSERFKFLIKKAWNAQTNEAVLEKASRQLFPFIEEFIQTGAVSQLWQSDYEEILALMKLSSFWHLDDLVSYCAHSLNRYVKKDNAVDTIILAHKEGFWEWKNEACRVLNQADQGIFLSAPTPKNLSFEFYNFKENALELFHSLSPYITHLVFGGAVSDSPYFVQVINEAPHLIGIDLNGSASFHEYLLSMPNNLRELDLSSCGWLDDRTLQTLISICPRLQKLSLVHNDQLSFVGWSELHLLQDLTHLDLSRCRQIDDESLKLISQSTTGLISIELVECRKISDVGLEEALRWWRQLHTLDVSGCSDIGDGTLFELAKSCPGLLDLRVAGCMEITEKGVSEIIRQLPAIRLLDLKGCYLKSEKIEEWRNIRPLANIVF